MNFYSMFIKIAAIVFLFLIWLIFPHSKSLSQVIRRRYGDKIIKNFRKFQKIDFCLRKAELDLEFLVKCRDNNVIARFLNFCFANRSLIFSLTYGRCQYNLLLEEIRLKKSNVRVTKKEFDNLYPSLQQQINSIDFAHICSKFLKINDLKLKSNSVVQQKKFCNLLKEKRCTQNPEKVIFNSSKYVLSDCKKSLLTRGLNFSIPCKKLDSADCIVQFELFFRDIRNLDILSNADLDFVKAKIKEAALSSYRSYNNNVPQNLSKEEFTTLQNLSKNKDLTIRKSGKGNSVVIVQRQDYLEKMNDILSDQKKFSKVSLKDKTLLNFAINQEKHVDTVLKKFVESKSMTEKTRKSLKPVGTRPNIIYGSCKVHKASVWNCPPFRRILSALNTPTYKLAKFLVPILKPLTTNEFTIKYSFNFAEEIVEQQHDLFMGSLDVDSLFTTTPLEETTEIRTNELFKESEAVEDLSKTEFKELLSLVTKDSRFIFNGTLYKQINGVDIGSPLVLNLANVLLVCHEKNWVEHCSVEYRPLYYRRYVDDIFVLFNSAEHLKRFYSYLNSRHLNISLIVENEKDNRMPFLDINIIREKDKFTTSVIHKPTFSGIYTHFDSFLSSSNKIGLFRWISACYIGTAFAQIGLSLI